MKIFVIIFLSLFCSLSAQRTIDGDTLNLRDIDDFIADDYGNIYIYKNRDFSFTKYDSLGLQLDKLMFTLPFKIQSVQNPLNISAFSENVQELRFYDQNLNEIHRIDFRQKFGFIKWLMPKISNRFGCSNKVRRLIQYNFREDPVINSFPFSIGFDDIIDLIVYDNTAFVLTKNPVAKYDFQGKKLFEAVQKIRGKYAAKMEIFLFLKKSNVSDFWDGSLENLFNSGDAGIVDKNSTAYFEVRGNKLYLYPIKS